MWVLYIISTIADSTEPKVTRYAELEHFESCYHAQLVLEEEFTQGEWTVCEYE